MVTYNPKDWIKLIFHFHKSDSLRILFPAIFSLGALSALICFIEKNYLKDCIPGNLIVFHQISGFIISLVLVFRINSAYDRWWEGRKLWGSLLNNSSNLAIKLNMIIDSEDKELRNDIQLLISNYSFALKEHLRGKSSENKMQYGKYLSKEEFSKSQHKPNFVASRIAISCKNILDANENTQINYLILNQNINEMTDICGGCERIKNTPIPYAYSIFIKKVVFLYLFTMPVTFCVSMGYWAIPVVMIMFYAFASLELISEEIEDPFGTDANDLPTDEITQKIFSNTKQILLPEKS